VTVVSTLGLGVWQVQRLFWKQALIDGRQSRSQATPLTTLPTTFNRARHGFRRARVSGRFIHGKELYIGARSLNGNLGFHVITPLKLADGGHILVNRGWIPSSLKTPSLRAAGQLRGQVTVAGYLRGAQRQGWFTRDNNAAVNMWYFVDTPAMAAATGLPRVKPFYLEAAKAQIPGGYPLGGQTRLQLRNDHLQYAIIWFSIALTGMVIWYLWHRRRDQEDDGDAGEPA
jgi:surfeit locus 1 family protein